MSVRTDLAVALGRVAEENYDTEVVAHTQHVLSGERGHPVLRNRWGRLVRNARHVGPKGQPYLTHAHGTPPLKHSYHHFPLHEPLHAYGDYPWHLFGRWTDDRLVLLVVQLDLGGVKLYHGERVIDVATLVPSLTANLILERLP